MKTNNFWKNNRGASLILVIGCVALLSVVGSMLLVITTNNREMKKLEESIQETFYQAESGSDDMASALEAISEEILQEAFSDMLIQYSELSDPAQREQRMAEYFVKALKNKLDTTSASDILSSANSTSASVIAVDIPEDAVKEEETTEAKKSNTIKIKGVTFTYQDGEGNESKITTDILIQTGLPDLKAGLNSGITQGEFSDFALITMNNVTRTLASAEIATVDGNLYTGGNIDISKQATLNLENADKILVKKDIIARLGTINIDNSGKIASGYGVWANGIKIQERGTLNGISNFYITDDLTFEEEGGKVDLGGVNTEYVGFSGNVGGEASTNSSAITINNAKDITIDFKDLNQMILSGNSYIYDEKWMGGGSILQGESLAYKDMQTMYLVPGECVDSGYNPMASSDYKADFINNLKMVYEYTNPNTGEAATFDFSSYLDSTTPFVTRKVVLDGGASEFTYLYWNFKDEDAAVRYFRDYIASPLGMEIKKRIESLGKSVIELAENSYARGYLLGYTGATDTTPGTLSIKAPNDTSGAESLRVRSAGTAKQRQKALFTTFRLNTNGAIDDGWDSVDVVTESILVKDYKELIPEAAGGWTKNTYACNGENYVFWTYKGSGTANLSSIPGNSVKGIILVDGNVTISATNSTIEGLVIATGEVDFASSTTLKANKDVVDALLLEPDVAKFFRVTASKSDTESQFISSEAIEVKFENWQKN